MSKVLIEKHQIYKVKVCKKCLLEKNVSEFYSGKNCKGGYMHECKICVNKRTSENAKKHKIDRRKYYHKNKKKHKALKKKYYESNKEEINIRHRKWYQDNKINIREHRNEYQRTKRKTDIKFRMRCLMNAMLHRILNNKSKSTIEIVGYTPEKLIQRLECQFKDGMSWENYGNKYGQWSIDHKKPISAFATEDNPAIINSLSNLQPMWHIENIKKSDSWIN